MLPNLPKGLPESLMKLATEEASSHQGETLQPLHMLIAICRSTQPEVLEAFMAESVDIADLIQTARRLASKFIVDVPGGPNRVSDSVHLAVEAAKRRSSQLHSRPWDPVSMLIVLLTDPDRLLKRLLQIKELPVDTLVKRLEPIEALEKPGLTVEAEPEIDVQGEKRPASQPAEAQCEEPAEARPEHPVRDFIRHPKTPTLDQIGKDYTALARTGKMGPIIGRREEIKQMARILLRKQKSNPLLVGEPGVGKTSVVEGLALHVVAPDAPKQIRDFRIVEVMFSSLLAGTKFRGDLEERIRKLIEEVESDPLLVLFFDEIHTLLGAGGDGGFAGGTSDLLKPALARGTFRCIGATVPDEYRRIIVKDPAFERRFQPVDIAEPTPEQTRAILEGLRKSYEEHHSVTVTDGALDAAVELSVKYLPSRRLPDKARDLIDQAAVTKRFTTFSPQDTVQGGETVDAEDVAGVVAEWTGIPVEAMTSDQRSRLLEMPDVLSKRVLGQEQAVSAVVQVVQAAFAQLTNPERPHGVFLFAGPTGVGKTELAKALAAFLFHDVKHLLRFDMSEYMEEHSVSKLIGSPPGYVGHSQGGQFTEAVRRTPYCVILLDEIEKAHPKVLDIFLQVFDDGRLTDSSGLTADFRNSIIIMTTNLGHGPGGRLISGEGLGFQPQADEPESDEEQEKAQAEFLRKAFRSHLRPELLNRINRIVPFQPLGPDEIRAIIDKLFLAIRARMEEKGIAISLAQESYDTLMQFGYKPEWGAREMERTLESRIVQPLARSMLDGKLQSGARLDVVLTPDDIEFRPATD